MNVKTHKNQKKKRSRKNLNSIIVLFRHVPLTSRCIEMLREHSQNPIVLNVCPHIRSGTLESNIIRPLVKLGGISNHKSSLVTKITLATIIKSQFPPDVNLAIIQYPDPACISRGGEETKIKLQLTKSLSTVSLSKCPLCETWS